MGRPLSVFWPCVVRVYCPYLLSAFVAAAVVRVYCPCLWRRHPGFHRRGDPSGGTSKRSTGRSSFGCRKRDDGPTTLQHTARVVPSGAASAMTARPRFNAPRGHILRPCLPSLIERGCDAHHDMRVPAPLGHPALFGCTSVCPSFARRYQPRRRLRFTPKSSGRNSR